MRRLVPGALALVAIPAILIGQAWAADPAVPKPLLGGELRERCAERPEMCQGYLAAVIDVEHFHSALAGRDPLYCVPASEGLPELVDRVSTWLAAHPEQRERPPVAQLTVALMDAFPCRSPAPAALDD